jgi:uncharacterized protein YqgC (DUF456 family)
MTSAEVILAALTFTIMVVGLIGVVVPVLPDVWLIWLAALGYGLLVGFDGWVGGIAIVLITLLTVLGVVVDLTLGHAAARRGGASWQAIAASIVLGLAGLWFFPPFGSLVGALLGLFLVEYYRRGRQAEEAFTAVKEYAKGCGWSMALRLGIGGLIILIWLAWVFIAAAAAPAA